MHDVFQYRPNGRVDRYQAESIDVTDSGVVVLRNVSGSIRADMLVLSPTLGEIAVTEVKNVSLRVA